MRLAPERLGLHGFFMELMVALFGVTHFAPFVAVAIAIAAERARRDAYTAFALPPIRMDDAPYRSPRFVETGHLERAPTIIRVAAYSSIVFGSAFVPGLAWAILGLLFNGIGLVSIPGLVIAAWLWKVGFGLLSAKPEAARSATRAARFSFAFNVLILVGVVVAATQWNGLSELLVFNALYALASLGQAVVLAKAARKLEELHDPATPQGFFAPASGFSFFSGIVHR